MKSGINTPNTSRKADLVSIPASTARYLAKIAFSGIENQTGFHGRTRTETYYKTLVVCAGDEDKEQYVVEDAEHYRAAMLALGKGSDLIDPRQVISFGADIAKIYYAVRTVPPGVLKRKLRKARATAPDKKTFDFVANLFFPPMKKRSAA